MKRKIKRYDGEDGSLVEDESERGSMTADQQANSDVTNAAAKTAEPQSFKQAFASARSGGDKTFTWQGKSYTTELASSKPAPKAEAPAPKTETKATPKEKASAPKEDSQPKSYADMAKNIPEGTSDTARQALMANLVKERQKKDEESNKNAKPVAEKSAGKKFREMLGSKYKSGGSVSSRGDGIAQRGRTKGTFR